MLRTAVVEQPALFAVEYALARQWMAWGVSRDALIGHSMGEYTAACLAGVIVARGRAAARAARGRACSKRCRRAGAMAAVFAPKRVVARGHRAMSPTGGDRGCERPRARRDLGRREALVTRAHERFRARRVSRASGSYVSHGFHSPLMEPVLDAFEQAVRRARFDATPRVQ